MIRCYLRWQSLPVILLAASPDGHHIKRAMELGVREMFQKSTFSLTELAELVEACAPPERGTGSFSAHYPLN